MPQRYTTPSSVVMATRGAFLRLEIGMGKYCPSNGTEGMMFTAEWCDTCERDRVGRQTQNGGCSILRATLIYDVTDARYPVEWREDDEGPRCTAFQRVLTPAERASKRAADRCAKREQAGQQNLFGDQP